MTMPSSASYPLPPFISLFLIDDGAASASVWLFPAAGLRIVVELESSPVLVKFSICINPEVTYARDNTITGVSSSFVHPMLVFSRCVSVRFAVFLFSRNVIWTSLITTLR